MSLQRRPLSKLVSFAAIAVMFACAEGNFAGSGDKAAEAKKKKDKGTNMMGPDETPNQGDAHPSKKIDCRKKTASECEAKVKTALKADKTGETQISVFGCKDDAAMSCEKIDKLGSDADQVILSDVQVADEIGIDEGNDKTPGSNSDKVKKDEGEVDVDEGSAPNTDTGTSTDDGTLGSDDGMTNQEPDPSLPPGEAVVEEDVVTCVPGANGPIDFESGASLHEVLLNQWKDSHGISFKTADGVKPILGQRGGEDVAYKGGAKNQREGWENDNQTADQPRGGYDFGQFFLTTADGVTRSTSSLIINYDPPADQASFDIIDVDKNEKFVIEAHAGPDGQGAVLQTFVLCGTQPPGGKDDCTDGPLDRDGRGTRVNFDRQKLKDIRSIAIKGTKSNNGLGIAFDNFSPRKICP